MGHYDCKYCDASPGEEHSADCERFQPMTNPKHTDTSRDDDLMERIEGCIANAEYDDEWKTLIDARDRIEALEAENERLREALKPFARAQHIVASIDEDRIRCVLTYPPEATHTFTLASLEAARAALGEK